MSAVRSSTSTASSPAGSASSSTTNSRSSRTVTRSRTRTSSPAAAATTGAPSLGRSYQRSRLIPSSSGRVGAARGTSLTLANQNTGAPASVAWSRIGTSVAPSGTRPRSASVRSATPASERATRSTALSPTHTV